MKQEILKEYKYYNSVYFVSQFGNVYNKNGKQLKLHVNSDGYLQVTLFRGAGCIPKAGRVKVHHMVASLFVEKPISNECLEVNHKDFNRQNNYYQNLEWVTHKSNVLYSYYAGRIYIPNFNGENNPHVKLTKDDVRYIRYLYSHGVKMRTIYQKYYNGVVSENSIENICRYRTWKNLK